MMYCSNCGEKSSADFKFCASCGAAQSSTVSEGALEESAPAEDSKPAFIAGYVVFGLLVLGVWSVLAGQVSNNAWLIHVIFGGWVAFALFGFTRKWSALVSFGGGFVGGMGLLAAALTVVDAEPERPSPGQPSASVASSSTVAAVTQKVKRPQFFDLSSGTGEWFSELTLSALAGDDDRRYLVIRGSLRNSSSSEAFASVVCTATVSLDFENGKSVDIKSQDICGEAGGAALAFMGDSSVADLTRLKLKPGETRKIDTSAGGQITAAMVSPLLNEVYASYPVSAARLRIDVAAETAFGDRVTETVLQTSIPAPAHKARFNLM